MLSLRPFEGGSSVWFETLPTEVPFDHADSPTEPIPPSISRHTRRLSIPFQSLRRTSLAALRATSLLAVCLWGTGCAPLMQATLSVGSTDQLFESPKSDAAWEAQAEDNEDLGLENAVPVVVLADEFTLPGDDSAQAEVENPPTQETIVDGSLPAPPIAQVAAESVSDVWTMAEIVRFAEANHPKVISAERRVDAARANIRFSSATDNPEFVVDVETPVHDRNDPTQLSTRVTFPILRGHERHARQRLAKAEFGRAVAWQRTVSAQVRETAMLSAQRLVYLQQRLEMDRQAALLANERVVLLSPEQRPGDAARNLVDYVDAVAESQRAEQASELTEREAAIARVDLFEAMGLGSVIVYTLAGRD